MAEDPERWIRWDGVVRKVFLDEEDYCIHGVSLEEECNECTAEAPAEGEEPDEES